MSKKELKVALIHDFLTEYGGAERVLETLVELFPNSPIYTAFVDKKKFGKEGIYLKDSEIVPTFFQKIPFFVKVLSPMRILAPWAFSRLDLSGFDLVISSTNTYFAKAVKAKGTHICYCHTPPRYLYGYPTARNWKKTLAGRIVGELMNFWLRQVDFKVSQGPTVMLANSEEVRSRIRKFYRRESEVVYPPVDVKKAKKSQKGEYYLVVSRLARAKRVDLAVKAAKRLKKKLVVVGSGPEREYLESLAGKETKFLGFVTDNQLWEIYAKAKAFLFTAEEEDFGITPVEAIAAGKPVVALRQGGVKETVIDGVTGVFFEKPTVGDLAAAIKKLETTEFDEKKLIKQAEKFSKERFKRKINIIVAKYAGVA